MRETVLGSQAAGFIPQTHEMRKGDFGGRPLSALQGTPNATPGDIASAKLLEAIALRRLGMRLIAVGRLGDAQATNLVL